MKFSNWKKLLSSILVIMFVQGCVFYCSVLKDIEIEVKSVDASSKSKNITAITPSVILGTEDANDNEAPVQ